MRNGTGKRAKLEIRSGYVAAQREVPILLCGWTGPVQHTEMAAPETWLLPRHGCSRDMYRFPIHNPYFCIHRIWIWRLSIICATRVQVRATPCETASPPILDPPLSSTSSGPSLWLEKSNQSSNVKRGYVCIMYVSKKGCDFTFTIVWLFKNQILSTFIRFFSSFQG